MADQKPHTYGSFDYKVIDPRIKRILRARSELDNTIQMAMPFVKATTTIKMDEYLGEGCVGFTLGLHAYNKDMIHEDMYSSKGGDAPLVGYTYQNNGSNKPIYANLPAGADESAKFFDQGSVLKTTDRFVHIPPPGIVQAKIGRNKSGLVAFGQIDFIVPSLIQLEVLHRVFMIPGCGIVLEWGQEFAKELAPSIGETSVASPTTPGETSIPSTGEGRSLIVDNMFPWYDQAKLLPLLTRLAKREVGIEEILDTYVYPSQGQYMWMFGRIANFSSKANSDGSFNCTVKILGPSEDAWAYSVKAPILPAIDRKTNVVCKTNNIVEYMQTTAAGENLKTLLDNVIGGSVLPEWQQHVQFFENGNKRDGVQEEDLADDPEAPNTSQTKFGESEHAYFFTWRFFINVILNNETYGLKAMFKRQLTDDQLYKISLLRPYADGPQHTPINPGDIQINDPVEPYVGRNKYLRSIDPSTLIIVHEEAAELAAAQLQRDRPSDAQTLTQPTEETAKFLAVGDFRESAVKAIAEEPGANKSNPDRGFLSSGVWLNHKAVIESLVGAETLLKGISTLLQRMNAATAAYWDLTVDSFEPIKTTQQLQSPNKFDYLVMDAAWRGSSDDAVKRAIDGGESGEPGLYIFNKYARTDRVTGKLVGSEVIDSSVDLKLPNILFAQISTMGLVQKEDLAEINPSLGLNPDEKSPLVSDPNEKFRKMFAITTLSSKSDGKQGPDLTILPYGQNRIDQQCGQANTQTAANTAGEGQRYGAQNAESSLNQDATQQELTDETARANDLLSSEQCQQCESEIQKYEAAQQSSRDVGSLAKGNSLPSIKAKAQQSIPDYQKFAQTMRTKFGVTDEVYIRAAWAVSLKESGGDPKPETSYRNTDPSRIRTVFGSRTDGYSDQQLRELSQNDFAFYEAMYGRNNSVGRGLGNTQPGDGYKFRGRGLMGLTGRANYASASRALYGDDRLVNNPELVNQQDVANDVAAWWFARPFRGDGGIGSQQKAPRLCGVNISDAAGATYLATTITAGTGCRSAESLDKAPFVFSRGNGTVGTLTVVREYYTALTPSNVPPAPAAPPPQSPPPVSPPPAAPPGAAPPAQPVTLSDQCKECYAAKQRLNAANRQLETIGARDRLMREFPYLERIYRYIEPFPDIMIARIRGDANDLDANAFGAAPGSLSISAELTMPGINGIRVGELFWIDRIPAFYRAFGAFQVLSVEDTISVDGWKTTVAARFNYLGAAWKQSTAALLSGGASAGSNRTGAPGPDTPRAAVTPPPPPTAPSRVTPAEEQPASRTGTPPRAGTGSWIPPE